MRHWTRAGMRMGQTRKRVLILENDTSVASLLESTLGDEGYESAMCADADGVVSGVRIHQPDLAIVDVPPDTPAALKALDDLRVDPVARNIPILTMSTVERVANESKASYTVREAITKPFDIDTLISDVEQSIELTPINAMIPSEQQASGPSAEAERTIAAHSRRALLDWVGKMRTARPWQGASDLPLADLLDGVPTIVEALDAALRYGNAGELLDRHPDVIERLQRYIHERRRQGASVDGIRAEYTLLREQLGYMLAQHMPEGESPAAAGAARQLVDTILDEIMERMLPLYDEAA